MLNANLPHKNNQTPIYIDSIPIVFSNHAKVRMQQRGIRRSVAQMIVKYADREVHIGKGLMSVSVSKKCAMRLGEENKLPAEVIEKLTGKSVVVANDNIQVKVVTVMHVKSGSAGRHYRKRVKRNWH